MSYRFVITAKSVAHLNEQILEAAEQLRKIPGDVPVGTTSDSMTRLEEHNLAQAAKLNASTAYGNITSPNQMAPLADRPANNRPFTGQATPVPTDVAAPKKRGPKKKSEKEGNAFLGNQTVATVGSQGMQAPPTQQMPTTQFNVGMPQMGGRADNLKVMEQPATPVAQTFAPPAPTPTPVNGYTFATFKANFIHIINTLANDGRIDESWIAVNAEHFGNKPIQDWPKQENVLAGLFDAMVEWQLVERIG